MEKFDLFNQSESFLNILHNFFQRHYKCYLLCCFHSKIPSYFFLNLTRYRGRFKPRHRGITNQIIGGVTYQDTGGIANQNIGGITIQDIDGISIQDKGGIKTPDIGALQTKT